MKNPSDNWDELRRRILGLGDGSIHKTHYPSLRQRVAELERVRAKLQRSEAYLSEAQRLSHTGSWAVNPVTGTIVYWSEEMFRIFGFDPGQGPPDRETVVQRFHPEDRERMEKCLQKAFREKADVEEDHRIILADGALKHLHVMGHPVLYETGDVVEYVGTTIDVTEHRRAEEERERLHQLQADLADINRVTTMGEMTALLAHEVNQPIAAAVANANACVRWLAGESPNVEEARQSARTIAKDANRAAEIISRLRLLFKKNAPHRELVDVNELIGEIVALMRNEASRHGIAIRTELAADLPPVLGDRAQLQQVLMNLMMNSIDAMKGVDGSRELVMTSGGGSSDQLLVSVSDTGVGLPPERDQIFRPFFTTKPHGTGMGLTISRSIIESHGGRLCGASSSGRGATFCFTLPTTGSPEQTSGAAGARA